MKKHYKPTKKSDTTTFSRFFGHPSPPKTNHTPKPTNRPPLDSQVGVDLPEKADVCVFELFDSQLLGERRRLGRVGGSKRCKRGPQVRWMGGFFLLANGVFLRYLFLMCWMGAVFGWFGHGAPGWVWYFCWNGLFWGSLSQKWISIAKKICWWKDVRHGHKDSRDRLTWILLIGVGVNYETLREQFLLSIKTKRRVIRFDQAVWKWSPKGSSFGDHKIIF